MVEYYFRRFLLAKNRFSIVVKGVYGFLTDYKGQVAKLFYQNLLCVCLHFYYEARSCPLKESKIGLLKRLARFKRNF